MRPRTLCDKAWKLEACVKNKVRVLAFWDPYPCVILVPSKSTRYNLSKAASRIVFFFLCTTLCPSYRCASVERSGVVVLVNATENLTNAGEPEER